MKLPSATGPATSPVPRGRSWRESVSAMLMAAAVYGPLLVAALYPLEWRWAGGFSLNYGQLLSVLPGMVLIAWLAPRVPYRRRDALLLLLPPWGLSHRVGNRGPPGAAAAPRLARTDGRIPRAGPPRRPDRRGGSQLPELAPAARRAREPGAAGAIRSL